MKKISDYLPRFALFFVSLLQALQFGHANAWIINITAAMDIIHGE